MTLVHNGTGSVEVAEASVEYTAMPHWSGDALRNYTGYFHCDGKYRQCYGLSQHGGGVADTG